jgi:hypothetical protein
MTFREAPQQSIGCVTLMKNLEELLIDGRSSIMNDNGRYRQSWHGCVGRLLRGVARDRNSKAIVNCIL